MEFVPLDAVRRAITRNEPVVLSYLVGRVWVNVEKKECGDRGCMSGDARYGRDSGRAGEGRDAEKGGGKGGNGFRGRGGPSGCMVEVPVQGRSKNE